MDSYIVRIYRRGAGDSGEQGSHVVGIVETVKTAERQPFKDAGELWAILRKAWTGKNQIDPRGHNDTSV